MSQNYFKDAKQALSLGKVGGAKKLLDLAYKQEHRQDFYTAQRGAYDVAYPFLRPLNDAEYAEYLIQCEAELVEPELQSTPFTPYDYETLASYPTYEEYRDETVVTTIAVEATYDVDGTELTPAIDEVVELVRPYTAQIQTDVDILVTARYRELSMPTVVTMRQARLALLQSGMLATVQTAITNGTDEEMKIEWEYATDVRRDWASLIALTTSMGLTAEQLDDLFILAGGL